MIKAHTSGMLITLFIGVLLSLLPLPPAIDRACPLWVLLILVYWAIETPFSIPIEVVWLMGILLDVSQSTLLGEHAFALTIVMLGVAKMSRQLHMFPVFQKILSVFFIMLIYQCILLGLQSVGGGASLNPWYWMTSVTSTLAWPVLSRILKACLP